MVTQYLEGKNKGYFIGKTPPEIWQEAVEQYGSVDKTELKRTIINKFDLLVKVAKVGGIAQRVYHDTPVISFTPTEPVVELPGEEWKDIKGYEGLYQVSTHGRVKGLKYGDKIMEPQVLNNGYLKVGLGKDTYLVHRLVATHFMNNPHNHPQVDHFDMDRQNCNVWNLRWVSAHQNNLYAKAHRELLKDENNRRVIEKILRLNTEKTYAKEPIVTGSPEALEAYYNMKSQSQNS